MFMPIEDQEELETRRDLLARARRGDQQARAFLLEHYHVRIYTPTEPSSGDPIR
ncbi:hypothetical protein [Candidatus Nitrospira bockiana]